MPDDAFLWDTKREPATDIYVTLREAEELTGVKASTIRNWARKGTVPSQVQPRRDGTRRLVDLSAAAARAARSSPPPPPPAGDVPLPEGHLLVPLDAWEKMLLQLGNLYQAGRDLAEARERAAKAETEAAFLRERLADIRTSLPAHPVPQPPPPPPERAVAETGGLKEKERHLPQPRWKRIYRAWRGK